jgi:uncharacterized protein YtpQ (UPF0354 family)
LQRKFVKQDIVAILQRHHPDWPIISTDDPLAVVIGNMKISLNNILLIVRNAPDDEAEKAIVDFFENIMSGKQGGGSTEDLSYATAKTRLLPQIIPGEFRESAPNLLFRPFFSGLGVACALDEDGGYELLQNQVLAAWDVRQETVEAQAIANLEAHCKLDAFEPRSGEEGAFVVVAAEDSYSAARLLLPQFMETLRASLGAERIFVGIPNRDFLVAWTPDFSGRQAFAAKIRRDAENEAYPLTDELFVFSERGVSLMSADQISDHGR